MIQGKRICPVCDKIHEGEGLSPSVKHKLNICGDCYKEKEYHRHKSRTLIFDLQPPKILDQAQINLFRYNKPIPYVDCVCDQCKKKLHKQHPKQSTLKHFCGSKCSAKFWKSYVIPDAREQFSVPFEPFVADITDPV